MRVNVVSESEISVRGHGVHTAYIEMARALDSRPDCKVIINDFTHRPEVDITHIHTVGFHAWSKLLFGKGKKVISAHVVPDSLVGSFFMAKYWKWAAALYFRVFYSCGDKVVAVSKTVAYQLEHKLGINPEKIEVVYNTIHTQQYKSSKQSRQIARKSLGYSYDDFVVIGNGQVQPRKRFDTFLHMAKKLPDVKFIWVGGIPFKHLGADYQQMKKLVESAPSNLLVTGVVELEEVKQYLQTANVFVLPAIQENHPMAVIEAAAAGLPIVLRDIPEYDDTFGQDTLRCKNDKEFIAAIQRLQRDNKLLQEFHLKANKIAIRFDSKTGAAQFMKLYRELLAKKTPAYSRGKA